MKTSHIFLIVGIIAFIALGLYAGAHLICQHRADYPGGLTFVGQPHNVFGATYWRVYMWRAPQSTDPLPDVTVSIDGKLYAFSALTPDIVTGLGGALMSGGLTDAQGNIFRYRFESNRLTWFSLDAESRRRRGKPPSSYHAETITMALGGGPQFSLPIAHQELVRNCGQPERAYLYFAQ